VTLPDGDGLSATRAIRGRHPGTEVIVMTLDDVPVLRRQALAAGAFAYVSKPQIEERLEAFLAELRELREERSTMNLKDGRVLGRIERFERVEHSSVLAAGLAHDLATPLGALELDRDGIDRAFGELEALARATPAGAAALARGRAALLSIDDACGYMARMLRDFRRLTRAPHDGETADVHLALATAMRYCRWQINDRVSVALNVPRDLQTQIAEHNLIRVFINLLLNAVLAFPGDGAGGSRWIDVVATRAGDTVTIDVSDNAGIVPPAVRHRLFEPYVTARRESGQGLGLALARALLRRAGGDLELVESDVERTRFRCSLLAVG
jgi:signal transduction histidine kinase